MASSYWLTRAVLLRAIGGVYAVAFLILVLQQAPLLGSEGLLPVSDFLNAVAERHGSVASAALRVPTLFWITSSDTTLTLASFLGLVLSLVVCAGFANAPIMAALWALYLSFVHVGQIFYGYGWDILLCETGFLAIFLVNPLRLTAFDPKSPPPLPIVVLLRWLTFRLMFGAGMIKIRGDECWRDLTCLYHHYETQPNPSPLSYHFHHLPKPIHQAGVLFNHLVELVAPFGVFGPRKARIVAGALIVLFQVTLILSGNLSFLNWLTIAIALSAFDDGVFERLAPARLRARLSRVREQASAPSRARIACVWTYTVLVMLLSISPVVNLLSERQRMNASFEPFDIVNTYGAFGSVSRERHEVVLEGTSSPVPNASAVWKEYEFPCKPGDPKRAPCLVTPYHYRLDWQLWFAALSDFRSQPWILNLVHKLLRGEPTVKRFLAVDPFPDSPPKFVRARFYRYRFTTSRADGTWWERELVGEYLHPLSLEHREFLRFLKSRGWLAQN